MDSPYIDGNINWPRVFANYVPPASHVAAEVQKPARMVDGYSLAVAYMRDCRARRSLEGDGNG